MASFRGVVGTQRDNAMERQESLTDTELTERLRKALEPVLPYGPSLIPLDILVVVATAHHARQPLSMKELMVVLPYSATGIRYNLAQLIADGWIIKAGDPADRRLVNLVPSERVAEAFARVREEFLKSSASCN